MTAGETPLTRTLLSMVHAVVVMAVGETPLSRILPFMVHTVAGVNGYDGCSV